MHISDLIESWRYRRMVAREMDALGADGCAALARDVGMSEDDLRRLWDCGPHAGEELPRLMRALSLDTAVAAERHPEAMRDMTVVCSLCDAASRCRRDLDRGSADRAFAGYCPNAEALARLRRDAAVAHTA